MEDWRKSSHSGANGGSYVETAGGAGVILVRDTTDHDGFTLIVPAETRAKFTAKRPHIPPCSGRYPLPTHRCAARPGTAASLAISPTQPAHLLMCQGSLSASASALSADLIRPMPVMRLHSVRAR
jgi:hypothetical protein